METASEVVGGPELSQQKPSILQESQAQAAILEALRARHTKELEALSSCQAIQLAELRTCQAAEDEAAQAQMLQLHQESADHLATQQLHVEAVSDQLTILAEYSACDSCNG